MKIPTPTREDLVDGVITNLHVPIVFTRKSRSLASTEGAHAQRNLLLEHYNLRKQCGTLNPQYLRNFNKSIADISFGGIIETKQLRVLFKRRERASAAIIADLYKELTENPDLTGCQADNVCSDVALALAELTIIYNDIIEEVSTH